LSTGAVLRSLEDRAVLQSLWNTTAPSWQFRLAVVWTQMHLLTYLLTYVINYSGLDV